MTDLIASLVLDEAARRNAFPVCRSQIFLAHAGVTALPRCVADAIIDYTRQSCEHHQEFGEVLTRVNQARAVSAAFIGAHADEIALLAPPPSASALSPMASHGAKAMRSSATPMITPPMSTLGWNSPATASPSATSIRSSPAR